MTLEMFWIFFGFFYYYYIIIKNKLGQVETGPAQLSYDRLTGSPTNCFLGLNWTRPNHLGLDGTGPAHDPHGYWPSSSTMLINFLLFCIQNYGFACKLPWFFLTK
jgi:hypothetical protein